MRSVRRACWTNEFGAATFSHDDIVYGNEDFWLPGPMPSRIEDYALIGNCESAAMVGRNGSRRWLLIGQRHKVAESLQTGGEMSDAMRHFFSGSWPEFYDRLMVWRGRQHAAKRVQIGVMTEKQKLDSAAELHRTLNTACRKWGE